MYAEITLKLSEPFRVSPERVDSWTYYLTEEANVEDAPALSLAMAQQWLPRGVLGTLCHYTTVHGRSYREMMAELRQHEAELASQAAEVAHQEFLDAVEATEVLQRERRAAILIADGYGKAFTEAMRENMAKLEAAIEAGMADPSNEEKPAYLSSDAYYEKMREKYYAAEEEVNAVSQALSSARENAKAAYHKSVAADEAADAAIDAHNQAAIALNQLQ